MSKNVYFAAALCASAGRGLSRQLSKLDYFPKGQRRIDPGAMLEVVQAIGDALSGGEGEIQPRELLEAVKKYHSVSATPFCPPIIEMIEGLVSG